MYNHTLTNLTFHRPQADSQDPETAQTGRPNWWRKLLAGVINMLFSNGQVLNGPDDEVTASQQPEIYLTSDYAAYYLEGYDLGLYWYDF